MSSSGGNGGGLESDDQRNKVTGSDNETVGLPSANLQGENQKLLEEVVTETKKTNTALAMQSGLYEQILGSSKSIDAIRSETNDVHTDQKLADLKKSTFENQKLIEETVKVARENQKLIEETVKLARENQTSLEIDARSHLANLQAGNPKLAEEVATETKKNNTALAMQAELCEKILGSSTSIGADCGMADSPDTIGLLGGKRLLGQEETSETGSKKLQKLNPEEDRSAEDQKD